MPQGIFISNTRLKKIKHNQTIRKGEPLSIRMISDSPQRDDCMCTGPFEGMFDFHQKNGFYFLVVLGIELSALDMIGRGSTT
jgi:hypothetical protein